MPKTLTPDIEEKENAGLGDGGPFIRCPKCRWAPRAHDRWMCNCGHVWNTFNTGGVCPGCLYQWTETACLACGQWSLHSDCTPRSLKPPRTLHNEFPQPSTYAHQPLRDIMPRTTATKAGSIHPCALFEDSGADSVRSRGRFALGGQRHHLCERDGFAISQSRSSSSPCGSRRRITPVRRSIQLLRGASRNAR
jgi:hypothetical protein